MRRWIGGTLGFVALADGQGLLGQVEGRTNTVVKDWLNQRDEALAVLPAMRRLGPAEILTFLQSGITNAGSEGTNRVKDEASSTPHNFEEPT